MCLSAFCMLQLCKLKHIKEHLRESFLSIEIFSTASETLCLQYCPYLTYKTVNYSSNCIKINLCLLFWKRFMQSHPSHPRKFKLISNFSYMRPVFPDYLSVCYDYGSVTVKTLQLRKFSFILSGNGFNQFSNMSFLLNQTNN